MAQFDQAAGERDEEGERMQIQARADGVGSAADG
jgi:hypothetical protein